MQVCTVCLTRLCIEPAAAEEVGGEVDVYIAEEQQYVASFPGSGPNVQTSASRKLLVQLQQSVVLKIHFPADTEREERKRRGDRGEKKPNFFIAKTWIFNKNKLALLTCFGTAELR